MSQYIFLPLFKTLIKFKIDHEEGFNHLSLIKMVIKIHISISIILKKLIKRIIIFQESLRIWWISFFFNINHNDNHKKFKSFLGLIYITIMM